MLKKNGNNLTIENDEDCELLQVKLNECTIKTTEPDNVVRSKQGKIFKIKRIFIEKKKLKCQGLELIYENAFKYPCDSDFVGVVKVTGASNHLKTIYSDELECKCAQIKIGGRSYVIELLHQ